MAKAGLPLALAALAASNVLAQSPTTPIKNVVLVMQENHSFDTILGYVPGNPATDNLIGKKFCNDIDVSDASLGSVCTEPGLAFSSKFLIVFVTA
ncbi:hypothetical protein BDK51DRAFT_38616 [Blyttiomyces helicus]|uniref:Phosphoesterase family-domain-containing protein n=1 Tax=Blyttiomyces helicus TaxID=388810 RepID=A0A4P9W0P6_9FUNG|nr:hypothetical protein BDK51DRAFT_38616 [Blyttiomyces helicus]|eukprot:RKO85664.1 hypothetical protein BDK51DRAFT_38616 [Blyttiomyces helicus]